MELHFKVSINITKVYFSSKWIEKRSFSIYIRSWTGLRGGNLIIRFFWLGIFFDVNPVAQKYYFLAKNVLDTIEELDKMILPIQGC